MQTFLPYKNFSRSAAVLDNKRLGKQRVEVLQLLNALAAPPGTVGWQNHPAAKMWKGHELALIRYGVAICDEWIQRGFNDTCRAKIKAHTSTFEVRPQSSPPWLGSKPFHRAHRSNLLRKDSEFYSQWEGKVPDDLPYIWPDP